MAIGFHSSLWQKPTVFEKSQRRYSWPKAVLFVRDIQVKSVYIINNNNCHRSPSNAPSKTRSRIWRTVGPIITWPAIYIMQELFFNNTDLIFFMNVPIYWLAYRSIYTWNSEYSILLIQLIWLKSVYSITFVVKNRTRIH